MSTMARVSLAFLIVLAMIAAMFIFRGSLIPQLVSTAIGIGLIVAIWSVKKMEIKQSLQSAKHPSKIDSEVTNLVVVIKKNFKDGGVDKIGQETQAIILKTMRGIKSGKVKSAKAAAAAMIKIPPSKFGEVRDPGNLASTLANYYLLADPETDLGYKTLQRIDNFIAGIDDKNL